MISTNQIKKVLSDPRMLFERFKYDNVPLQMLEGWLTRRFSYDLFDYEWDVAIVLDACRYDMATRCRTLTDELGHPERVYSTGAHSTPWTRRTVERATQNDLRSTEYVSANHNADQCVDKFGRVHRVWDWGFDKELGGIPPRVVTDTAIKAGRIGEFDRLLVHYMQPHMPALNDSLEECFVPGEFNGSWKETNPWYQIKVGNLDPERAIAAYNDNLEQVAEEVLLLLSNINAEQVIVTADHGNLLGELNEWGHHIMFNPHPGVRHVPLFKTSATDTEEHEPKSYDQSVSTEKEEVLAALGYL